MAIQLNLATSQYFTLFAAAGANFLDKCYAWTMAQANMNGSIEV